MSVRLPLSISLCALAVLFALPSKAEFPPEGAVADPRNPALATGDYSTSAQSKSNAKAHYVFYFDCAKRMWIGVATSTSGGAGSASPHGREFAPGPPTGARRDTSDPNRATNIVTHQTFAFSNGVWIDTKSRQVARSAKLCPNSVAPSVHQPASEPPVPVKQEKPDSLPPPPVVNTKGDLQP